MAEDLATELAAWEPPAEFDGFHIVRPIGHGGMGRVYLARDLFLSRLVAIKFATIFPGALAGVDRFDFEAQALARLQHPNVVSIYRHGSVNGVCYLALEFVFGKVLSQMHRPISVERLGLIAEGLLNALRACHRAGIVHRDIKPSNVMLSHENCVKLLDFGLAQLGPPNVGNGENVDIASMAPVIIDGTPTVRMDSSNGRFRSPPPANSLQTDTPFPASVGKAPLRDSDGLLIGTPLYMAPERWLGRRATQRSDLFALGLLLRELAVGQHPFAQLHGATLMRAVLDQDLPPIRLLRSDIPSNLATAIDSMMRRSESDRPESADEVLALLARGEFWDHESSDERSGLMRRSGILSKAQVQQFESDEDLIGRIG